MKGKKNVFHPKSYPVPPQTAVAASRNQYSSNMIKGGTVQPPAKTTVVRTTKSPPGLGKRVLDVPTNPNPKLMMSKQPQNVKPPAQPRSIKPENDIKVMKKSLSNNDIHLTANKSESPKPNQPQQQHQRIGSRTRPQQIASVKHHSPSPTTTTMKAKSPSPPRGHTSKFSTSKPTVAKPSLPKGKVSEFKGKNTPAAIPPWSDFV